MRAMWPARPASDPLEPRRGAPAPDATDSLQAVRRCACALDGAVRSRCGRARPLRHTERAVRRTARAWARGTLRLLGWCVGLTYVEEGQENIPTEPCLIVANHQSTWETFAFLALVPDVAIVAKQELLGIPVFGWFLRNAPMILIDRESGTKAVRKMVDESRTAL